MKKNSEAFKTWLRIHSRNAMRRRLSTRRKNYKVGRFVRGEIRLRAPSILCLSRNYLEVVALIDRLQSFMMKSRTFVDFKPIQTVSLDAALLLAAMLDMWQRLKRVKLRTRDVDKWLPDVSHAFESLGLFELLQTPGQQPTKSTQKQNLEILKLSSGQGSDGSLAAQLTQALAAIAGKIDNDSLYVGLTEAMTNVGQHAYPTDLYQGVPNAFRRWWMTGSYNHTQKCLSKRRMG